MTSTTKTTWRVRFEDSTAVDVQASSDGEARAVARRVTNLTGRIVAVSQQRRSQR